MIHSVANVFNILLGKNAEKYKFYSFSTMNFLYRTEIITLIIILVICLCMLISMRYLIEYEVNVIIIRAHEVRHANMERVHY